MVRLLLLVLGLGLSLPGLAQVSPPATPLASLPFDVVGGALVLRQLLFNGRRGDFLLDTGCAYPLVVEQAAFPGQLRPATTGALGAAGATALYELPVTQFELGEVRPPLLAQATSLAALRAVVGPQLLGLIGSGLLRRFELVLDYAHHRLSIYALGAQQSAARPFTRRDSVAFTLEHNWPLVQATIGAVPVRLLLDTGAGENYLATDFAQALPGRSRPVGIRRETVAAPGGRLVVQRATLPALQVGATAWRNLPVLLAPPVPYPSGRPLPYQGVLGGPFLRRQGLVSFHFGRGQLYLLTPR